MTHVSSRQRRLLRKALSRSRACASIEELAALGDAPQKVREHVHSCARCQSELALMADFEAAMPGADERSAVTWITMRLERQLAARGSAASGRDDSEPWWQRWFRLRSLGTAGLAVATAMVVIAIGVGLRQAKPPRLEAPGGSSAFRSGELIAIGPAGDVDAPPVELQWEPISGAASYAVRISEVDGSELWSADTRQTAVALPQSVRDRAVPGKPLVWQVTAKDAAGSSIARSAATRFRVRAANP